MRRITYRTAINEALREEMERDGAVILLGEDIGPGGVGGRDQQGLLGQVR